MRITSKQRTTRVTVAFAVSLAIASGTLIGEADAQVTNSFDLSARSDTFSVSYTNPSLPLFSELIFTPGSAQVSASSFGGTSGFAGAPYAGDLSTLPGTVNGLAAGDLPPLPSNLPGYVTSAYPQNPDPPAQEAGPYKVATTSAVDGASSEARMGAATDDPAAISSVATATVEVNENTSIAEATARTDGFSIAGIVDIGTVRTTARVEVRDNGTIERTSSVDLGTITVAGLKIGLTQDGLVLGDPSSPTLGLGDIGLGPVQDLLAEAGIALEFLPGSESENSITSAGMLVRITQDVPSQGENVITITLGRATAAANVRSITTQPSVPVTQPSAAPPNAPAPAVTPTPAAAAALPSAAPAPTETSPTPTPIADTSTVQLAAIDIGPDGLDFYLVLVLSFLVILGSSRITSALAVRLRTSR